ncbi:phosphatase PAP2 family protein [Methylobacterium sp. A54F]
MSMDVLSTRRFFVCTCRVGLAGIAMNLSLLALMPQGIRLPAHAAGPLALCLALGAAGVLLAAGRWDRSAVAALALAHVLLLGALNAVGHLAPAYLGRGFAPADAALARLDALLGFDWPAYFAWHAAHPAIGTACRVAYLIWPQMALILVVVLARHGCFERLARLIAATALALALVYLAAILVPAYGAYVQHGMSPALHPDLPVAFSDFKPAYDALRAGLVDLYAEEIPSGAISFPSFHTTTILLYAWAAWPTPARWPILAVQAACFLAVPVQGAHFLTDMIAGGAIGLVAIRASAPLVRLAGGCAPGMSLAPRTA